MSWAARITTAPGVELRVVFSEPMRTLDMTRDTARKLAGLILVAAEDREPAMRATVARVEKPGVFQRATVARKELSGNHVCPTVSLTSAQPKTGQNVFSTAKAENSHERVTSGALWLKTSQSDSSAVCCCVVPFGASGCEVHHV